MDKLDAAYKDRIARGMATAGAAWQQQAREQPAKMQGPWPDQLSTRTGNLANKANFQVTGDGKQLNLTAPTYYRFLLFGTGLFGPLHSLIYPQSGRVFRIPFTSAWSGKKDALYTRFTRGSIWEGKLDQVKNALIAGFKQGVSGQ
jgi:hypothetical protein